VHRVQFATDIFGIYVQDSGDYEKADEWAELAAEEPDARGVEWQDTRAGRRHARCRSRSLAHLKQEISKKKWAEARQWAGGQTSKKYRMPSR